MLQTKIFLSDSDGDSSQFCSAADYFNALNGTLFGIELLCLRIN